MDERAAFEKNSDANPKDATNQLVFADWLDEHGEPAEADFRRKMGEWLRDAPNDYELFDYGDFRHRVVIGKTPFPREYLPPHKQWHRDDDFHTAPAHVPRIIAGRYTWPSYRGMELAFRQAHYRYNSDPERQAEKMSRAKFSRRQGRYYKDR